MYCPHCGTKLNGNNQNFCPNCGSKTSTTLEPQPTSYITVPVQKTPDNDGRPGSHSNKCLGFALASVIMGIATAVIGLIILIILRIIGSTILLIIHIVGLNLALTAKKHGKKAAELEPSNPVEKVGSVFVVFGIIINAILIAVDIIFTIIFLIILGT